jgi:hypothetical protein
MQDSHGVQDLKPWCRWPEGASWHTGCSTWLLTNFGLTLASFASSFMRTSSLCLSAISCTARRFSFATAAWWARRAASCNHSAHTARARVVALASSHRRVSTTLCQHTDQDHTGSGRCMHASIWFWPSLSSHHCLESCFFFWLPVLCKQAYALPCCYFSPCSA